MRHLRRADLEADVWRVTLFDPDPPNLEPAGDDEKRALVALSLVPGVGPGRVRALLAAMGSALEVLRAPSSRLLRADGVGRQTADAIRAWDDVADGRPAVCSGREHRRSRGHVR